KRLASVRNVISLGGGKKTGNTFQSAANGRCWVRTTIGSDAKIGPNFIVGAIVEATGLAASSIGKINIYSDHTDIELSNDDAALVLTEMQNTKIKGCAVSFTKATESAHGIDKRPGSFARHGSRDFHGKKDSFRSARHGATKPYGRTFKD
ncbi:MAG: DbpA RNA binding domain-containing protein, partial [Pygmaiobacter sp.]